MTRAPLDSLIVRRLASGDETDAIRAIHRLKPAAERDGQDASPEHMQQLLAREENYFYVATSDDRPVGFLLAYRVPRIDRDQDMVYLYEIEIVAGFRRRGIGSRMIELLKQDCRRHNVLKVWVGTAIANVAARALFKATGARCQSETYTEYTYTEF